MASISRLFFGLSLVLSLLSTTYLFSQEASSSQHSGKPIQPLGRSTYNSTCAGCHGLDGHGSDKGANISGSAKVKQFTDEHISELISNGVPGTGMPAFRNLSFNQLQAVVAYLRSLQGRSDTRIVSGDPGRGQQIFFGKGVCSACHTVSGKGGFLGPDLSGYGNTASPSAIREEIIRMRRVPQLGYRSAVVTTSTGDRIEGVIRNEDNFSLQVQSKDGGFHFFQKSELRSVDRLETSLMPSDYGDRLNANELNDLISYLMSAEANAGKTRSQKKKNEDDDE
jgi:cytochrome c oxidase cbb3-type subunit III